MTELNAEDEALERSEIDLTQGLAAASRFMDNNAAKLALWDRIVDELDYIEDEYGPLFALSDSVRLNDLLVEVEKIK